VLTADVSTANALANWPGDDRCVAADEPVAEASQAVADLAVLPGLPAPASGAALDTGDGISATTATIDLPASAGPAGTDTRAVRATTSTVLVPATILGVIGLEVVGTAELTATATGIAGTADVSYTAPLVRVTLPGGGDPIVLDAASSPLGISLPNELAPLVTVDLAIGTSTENIAADGTTASATAAILDVEITLLAGTVTLADLAIGPMTASATAPAGGLQCPIPDNPLRDTHKDVSATQVTPGSTFDYQIIVPNRDDECTLTDVRVVDEITGPSGFEVTGTAPPASSVSGGTVVWDDIGPLAPGQTATLTVTIRVPSNAPAGSTFSDRVTVTGVCEGIEFEQEAEIVDVPEVVTQVTERPRELAATGRDTGPWLAMAAVAALALIGLRRLAHRA
jgi:hypothetical protein